MKLYKSGGVSNSHKLVRGIQMKKGNQQMTKIPITMPRVTAALKIKKIREIDNDHCNERMSMNVLLKFSTLTLILVLFLKVLQKEIP